MSRFLNTAELTPNPDGKTWTLFNILFFLSDIHGSISVPAGFVTDLASIPRLFWNILPPFGKWTMAAILHDYLYQTQTFTRAQCDAVLLDAMTVCGVGWFTRQLIYRNVRAFGWLAWRDGKKLLKPV